ncbi:uncharacterized protein LOC119264355 isoform X2 [Pygocentrus nattereri]|uniref:uncharacterized protein LOC119264355 isoform X2 n=1 Tax=Pygocentrus nattereri TaxID=42514 RepID=UPI001890D407|nr:uncharacterized protein LOC119264355 isoform X2 [Pygocentrus nattereri]
MLRHLERVLLPSMARLSEDILKLVHQRDTLNNRRRSVRWMQRRGILKRSMRCCICTRRMRLRESARSDGLTWVCGTNHKAKKTSVRYGSVMYKSRKSLARWLMFIYRFSQGLQLRQLDMLEHGIAGSSRTLTKMAHTVRKVCMKAVSRLKSKGMKVGGRHHFVVLDESKFSHKRKYNRGRFGNSWRRKRQWVFGMLEVGITTRRPILKLVKTRSRRVLLRVIRRHVKRGSYIMSDEWRAYRGQLSQYGYQHFSVCHKDNFVDARTGSHTQHIERAWQTYKVDIWRHRGNRTSRLLKVCWVD